MYGLKLDQVEGAAVVTVLGRLDTSSVPDFGEALGVLDAEAVIVVNLAPCSSINDDGVEVLLMLNCMRNGRFVIVAEPQTQPRFAIEARANPLQIVSSFGEARVRAAAIAELAHRTFSNRAESTPARPPSISSPRPRSRRGTGSTWRQKPA